MSVHANFLIPNDVESPPPPKDPPPIVLNNISSYNTSYKEIMANRWENLTDKKPKINIHTIKCKSIISLPTPEDLKEDTEVINLLDN